MARTKKKVFVGLSGGVDSSVAAALLKKRGHEVIGVHLRCFNIDGCAERDAEDARRVSEHLSIPFYIFDFEEEYKRRVVDYMVEGYRVGMTPNPDVMCNREIKFGLFFDRAMKLGADYIATGHYVRKKGNALYVAKDTNKDQSYFLWTLTKAQIQKSLFPIGDYTKSTVRRMARQFGLSTADKKDSQGICFLGQVSIADFLEHYIKKKTGAIVTTQGKKVGEHKGVYFYTIGQRQGLDLKNISKILKKKGDTKPFYIAEKDVKSNTLIIAEEGDEALLKKEVQLTNINSMNDPSLIRANRRIEVLTRVRYRQPLALATLIAMNHSRSSDADYTLVFEKPVQYIASGQSAVFYSQSGMMLGGGIIV